MFFSTSKQSCSIFEFNCWQRSRHLDKLNNICLWWTGTSVIVWVFFNYHWCMLYWRFSAWAFFEKKNNLWPNWPSQIIVILLAMADTRNSGKFAFSHVRYLMACISNLLIKCAVWRAVFWLACRMGMVRGSFTGGLYLDWVCLTRIRRCCYWLAQLRHGCSPLRRGQRTCTSSTAGNGCVLSHQNDSLYLKLRHSPLRCSRCCHWPLYLVSPRLSHWRFQKGSTIGSFLSILFFLQSSHFWPWQAFNLCLCFTRKLQGAPVPPSACSFSVSSPKCIGDPWSWSNMSVLGIWVFAAIGSLTAASRCTWAFSRDGGIPASGWWKKVDERFGIPVNSLILSAVVCALLGLIYLGSSAAFNAFTGGEFVSSINLDNL